MGKQILGLDLGTNSIGWAVVDDLGAGQFDLVKRGVHVFPEAVNEESQGGARKSKATGRREKRSARKLNYRRKIRKINTLEVLVEHGMCPGITTTDLDIWRYGRKTEHQKRCKEYPLSETFRKWQSTNDLSEKNKDKVKRNPYLFRFDAIDRKFDWNDERERQRLGRVFYHLAQRRGFKSNSLDGGSDDAYDAFYESLKKYLERKHDSSTEIIDIITELTTGEQDKKVKNLKSKLLRIFKKQSDLEKAVSQALALMENPEYLGKVKKGIFDLDQNIKESHSRTLGEYYYQCYEYQTCEAEFDETCRVQEITDERKKELYGEKIRGHYTDRETHYEKEFNEICRVQGLDDGLKKQLYDAIFYQRPLRSQKGLIGNCSLEFRLPVFNEGKPVCRIDEQGKTVPVTYSKKCVSVSHPIFEEFRMWSFINQIKWKKKGDARMQFLSENQKGEIEHLFFKKNKPYFKFSEITKLLFGKNVSVERVRDEKKKPADYYVNYALDTSVSGCPVVSIFRDIFGKKYRSTLVESYKGRRENKNQQKKSADDILTEAWGVLFSREEPIERKRQLLKNWGVSENVAEVFSEIKLPKGYASLSLAAMRKIVPLLKEGMIYSHAVLFANLPAVFHGSEIDVESVKVVLAEKLDSYSDYRKQVALANEFISDFVSSEPLRDEMKDVSVFTEKIGRKFERKFGIAIWDKIQEEKYSFAQQVMALIKSQCSKENEEGRWIKLIPIKTILKDILIDEFGITEERVVLLYHPSDIQQHNPYRKSETIRDGKTLLESPIVSSIKNPVFMRTMHRLKAVVNALVLDETISSETEIHVEMARDLNTANMRAVIELDNKLRQMRREKYAEIIKNLMKREATDTDLLRFKLWEELTPEDSEKDWLRLNAEIEAKSLKYELWVEQKRICPYTGKTIGLFDFLGENPRFEIEHILPRSRSYDNSEENLTLCCKKYNREIKKSSIPSECDNHKEILLRIEHWKERFQHLDREIKKTVFAARNADPERKAKIIQKRHRLKVDRDHYAKKYEHFTMKEVPESFANRQLNDTRIITKYACFYLKSVFGKVMTVNGATVATLRKQWGLQTTEKKSREKHTHHCIDAIVIACMTKHQYNQLKAFYEREENEKFGRGKPKKAVPQPWKNFVPSIKQLEIEVLVSHYVSNQLLKKSGVLPLHVKRKIRDQPKSSPKKISTARARLHKDTFYGRIMHKGELISVVRVPLISSKEALKGFKNLADIESRVIAENIKKTLKKVVEVRMKSGMNFPEALKDPIFQNEKKKIPIKRVRCKANMVKDPLKIKNQRDKSKKYNQPYKQYFYAGNSSVSAIALYELDGEIIHDGYDALTAVQKNLIFPKEKEGKKGGTYKLQCVLSPKQKVLFYEKSLDELKKLSDKDLSVRLFQINDLSKKEKRMVFRHHLAARKKGDLEAENKKLRGTKFPSAVNFCSPNPLQRIPYGKLKIAIEDVNFRLSVLGEIEFMKE